METGNTLLINNWPVGKDRSYVQIVNPDALRNVVDFDYCPVEVVSYREENQNSLEAIKDSTVKRLDDYIKRENPSKVKYILASTLLPVSAVGALDLLLGGRLSGEDAIRLGSIFEVATLATSGGLWLSGSDYHKSLKEGNDVFKKTPVEKFTKEKNNQLADIADAIEKNTLPNVITPHVKGGSYVADELLKELDGSINPHTKTVYQQMKDAYRGYLVGSAPIKIS